MWRISTRISTWDLKNRIRSFEIKIEALKIKIEALKLKLRHSKVRIPCHPYTGKKLRASPMLRSYPPNSVHANHFSSINKLLSIKPVLLGVDWILRFRDSLCRPNKSCELAPCCARFHRISSTPIDSTAKISPSLISQFWVELVFFAPVNQRFG